MPSSEEQMSLSLDHASSTSIFASCKRGASGNVLTRPARCEAMALAARRPNTSASAKEFPASRLAPWTPVQAHSPTA